MPGEISRLEANEVGGKETAKEGLADRQATKDLRGREGDMHEEPDWDIGRQIGGCTEEGRKKH